jgi:hypothetical protein
VVWPPGTSLIGPAGTPGAPGNTVLYGASDPVAATGVDGNFYINTTTHFIFGPKAGGAWPAGASMIGTQGPAGPQGPAGTATVICSDTPPVGAADNALWFESDSGLLYFRYNDGTSTQWVIACPQPDTTTFAQINSPVFTGDPKAPTPTAGDNDTSIATTAFVAAAIAGGFAGSQAGYQKFPDGVIMQWGASANGTTPDYTISFPVTFPTAVQAAVCNHNYPIPGNTAYIVSCDVASTSALNLRKRTVVSGGIVAPSDGINISWIAIGA